jgi:hypothetical protein
LHEIPCPFLLLLLPLLLTIMHTIVFP